MLTTQFFAMKIRRYMSLHGITPQTLGRVAEKAFANGALADHAWRREPVDAETILASPMVSDPLTKLMFCSPGEGAVALIFASERRARELGLPAVRVRAAVVRSRPPGSFEVFAPALDVERGPSPTVIASQAAYEMAGVGPEDIGVAQLQDTESGAEIMHMAENGFCADGEQEQWLAEGRTRIGGALPVNTDGGCLACGEPIGASGLRQVYENYRSAYRAGGRAAGAGRPAARLQPCLWRARRVRGRDPRARVMDFAALARAAALPRRGTGIPRRSAHPRASPGRSAYHRGLRRTGNGRPWQAALEAKGWLLYYWPKAMAGRAGARWSDGSSRQSAPAPGRRCCRSWGSSCSGRCSTRSERPSSRRASCRALRRGEHVWAQGFSEPGRGSDLASSADPRHARGRRVHRQRPEDLDDAGPIRQLAVRAGSDRPDVKPQLGISFLLIDMSSPGVTVRPIISASGDHELNEVFLDEVRVPVANRVGEEGEGWSIAKFLLENERGCTGYAPQLLADLDRAGSRGEDCRHTRRPRGVPAPGSRGARDNRTADTDRNGKRCGRRTRAAWR